MSKIYFAIYILGILMFFLSFFGNTTPHSAKEGDRSVIGDWYSGDLAHIQMALDPLVEGIELFNVINLPSKYTNEFDVYTYKDYLTQAVLRLLRSIPISIGWFTIVLSIFFTWKLFTKEAKSGKFKYLVLIGGICLLISVPLLAYNFYYWATIWKPYFHLGASAYLIVFAYLFVGIALLQSYFSQHIKKTES
jgi:hypothetical protein